MMLLRLLTAAAAMLVSSSTPPPGGLTIRVRLPNGQTKRVQTQAGDTISSVRCAHFNRKTPPRITALFCLPFSASARLH
jgi:hypothetical protein